MVPARNLLRRHCDTYGGGCFDIDSSHFTKQSPLRSNLMMMAEHQPSTTGDPAHEQTTDQEEAEAAAAAASAAESEQEQLEAAAAGTRNIAKADDSWLQLGIGLGASSSSSSSAPSRPSVELELFPDKPSTSSTSSLPTVPSYRPTGPPPTPPVFSSMAQLPQLGYRPPPWGFWNSNLMQYNMGGGSSSSSTPPPMMMMMPPPSQQQQYYNVQRFPLPARVESGGPRFGEMRVLSPPPPPARQQHTGVWFLLRAAENQVREPFLPQIPKSYIRIKDGRMTVRLLMKYLVKKLGLDDESEVQISCRGQPLLPFLTLQHVRDNIWCLREAVAFLPDSPSIDHVMTLQYGRSP